MTNPCDALVALAAGGRDPGGALLHNVRLEGWGADVYGEEAVLELVRSAPFRCERWDQIADGRGAAIVADDVVWIADTVGDLLVRVWRLGPGEPAAAEPRLALPFDTELQQARRAPLGMRMQGLATDRVSDLETLVGEAAGGIRGRAFPLRAIIGDAEALVLFAVHRLIGRPVRTSAFTYMAARLALAGGIDAAVILRDLAGELAADQRSSISRL